MKNSGRIWYEELRIGWKYYMVQSMLAGGVMFLLLLFMSLREEPVIIASMGSTAFIIFATPKVVFAKPKNVIGGHLTGLICGLIAALILKGDLGQSDIVVKNIAYSLAVAASIFIMTAINFEHPPAAGTALGIAIHGWQWHVIVAVVVSAVLLSVAYSIAKKHLRNLI